MTTRECDHCSDHTAELMSLVDHEFTGDEVRAINRYMADLEAKHAAEMRELQRQLVHAQEPLRTGDRLCDKPGCLAVTIRRASGKRVCAEGHPPRFVVIDSQDDVLARAEKLEAELAEARATIEQLRRELCHATEGALYTEERSRLLARAEKAELELTEARATIAAVRQWRRDVLDVGYDDVQPSQVMRLDAILEAP